MSKVRDVNTAIGMIDRGEVQREANRLFEEVLRTLNDLSSDLPKKKFKGQVKLTLDVEVVNGTATISAEVSHKLPKPERGSAFFWLTREGELTTELADGRTFVLKPGMSYQVADNAEPHRSTTAVGAKLFVVD